MDTSTFINTAIKAQFEEDYARGMAMLRLSNRAFAIFASGLGYPNPNSTIPTAQVTVNVAEKRVSFEINPDFIRELSDSDIAAVIAHETYHVLLNHLSEIGDRVEYPSKEILIQAQECIINDTLPGSVGFETMEGTLKGMEMFSKDFSDFSTREGYDFIAQNQKEQEQQRSENGSNGDSGDSEASGSGDADGNENDSGACGGIEIQADEDSTPEETAEGVKNAIAEALDNAIDKLNQDAEILDPEFQEMIEDLKDTGISPSKTPNMGNPNANKDAFSVLSSISGMNMNWVELLAVMNPKIKSSGKPKVRDSWHAPRRKMIASYPRVILPVQRRLDDPNSRKGDSLPTFVIALDMSGSIPERLLGDLAALASSVPENLIKAFPITWSDNAKVFDKENPKNIVRRGGTNIRSVYDYAEKVERETGNYPYVLVITDGGYNIPYGLSKQKLQEKWYWMAIEPNDKSLITRVTAGWTSPERIFSLKDFN